MAHAFALPMLSGATQRDPAPDRASAGHAYRRREPQKTVLYSSLPTTSKRASTARSDDPIMALNIQRSSNANSVPFWIAVGCVAALCVFGAQRVPAKSWSLHQSAHTRRAVPRMRAGQPCLRSLARDTVPLTMRQHRMTHSLGPSHSRPGRWVVSRHGGKAPSHANAATGTAVPADRRPCGNPAAATFIRHGEHSDILRSRA